MLAVTAVATTAMGWHTVPLGGSDCGFGAFVVALIQHRDSSEWCSRLDQLCFSFGEFISAYRLSHHIHLHTSGVSSIVHRLFGIRIAIIIMMVVVCYRRGALVKAFCTTARALPGNDNGVSALIAQRRTHCHYGHHYHAQCCPR